jgi:hypothetical protein
MAEIMPKHSAEFSPIASQDLRYKFNGGNKVPGKVMGECPWGTNNSYVAAPMRGLRTIAVWL